MSNKTKTRQALIAFTIAAFVSVCVIAFSLPAHAETQFGLNHQHLDLDAQYPLREDKGLSGVSIGFPNGDFTTRFSYGGGDIWADGVNHNLKSLRGDLEYDITSTKLRPYIVGGIGHLNTHNGVSSQGATYASGGLGLKLNFTDNLMASVDLRTMTMDRGHLGSATANFQVSYQFGGMESPAPVTVPHMHKTETKVIRTKPKGVAVYFPHDSHHLSPEQKMQIAAFVANAEGAAVIGYTSPSGSEEYNQNLSEQRARVVTEFIKSVRPDLTVKYIGLGETRAEDETADERRAEIYIR